MTRSALFTFALVVVSTFGAPTRGQAQEQEHREVRREFIEREHRGEPEPRERAEGGDRQRARDREKELRQEMTHLQAKLRELVDAGEEEEAAELKEQLGRLEREFPGREAMGRREREEHREGPAGGPDEMHRRLHHLTVAIEHLHQGGFHEPAEQLEREANRLREQLNAGIDRREERREERRVVIRRGPPMEGLHGELAELREQLNELRQAVREMREHLGQQRR